jgi:hypothetical protein
LQSFGARRFGIFGKYWIIIVFGAGVIHVTVDLIKRHPRSKLWFCIILIVLLNIFERIHAPFFK